jgi:Rieske Fe-S protein
MSAEVEVEVEESGPDRRSVMKAAALVVVPVAGVGTVAACSSGGSGSKPASGGGSGSGVSVPSSSVPLGGGFVDQGNNIVVTQPEAGVFKAFTAVCTHQGCTVGGVTNNRIVCPCHGSVFSAEDGSVINGPASAPLAPMTTKVSGANVEITGASK